MTSDQPPSGREAHIGRQRLRRRRAAGGEQHRPAGRRGSQLLLAGAGGAATGLRRVPAGPGPELGGVPQQRRGLGHREGVSPNRYWKRNPRENSEGK